MDDLISRQAAIDAIENAFDRETILNRFVRKIAISAVRMLPSAQPEIVMCVDCQKYIDYRCRDEHANLNDWRHEDDYCSFGERREELNESKERP